jgi:hypothetical protein
VVTDDAALFADCKVHFYRASGPGGQNRNKVETAVRLHHVPSGITVTATESRSQAENKSRALRRLRKALALRVRHPVGSGEVPQAIAAVIGKDGRLSVGQRDSRYLAAAGALLDLLLDAKGSVSGAAQRLRITTANLSAFLTKDDELMTEANRIRSAAGLKTLGR